MEFNTEKLTKFGTASTIEDAISMGIGFIKKHEFVFEIRSPDGKLLLGIDAFNDESDGEAVQLAEAGPWAAACRKHMPWTWFNEHLLLDDQDDDDQVDPEKVYEHLGIWLTHE